jgi:hypothetical protein
MTMRRRLRLVVALATVLGTIAWSPVDLVRTRVSDATALSLPAATRVLGLGDGLRSDPPLPERLAFSGRATLVVARTMLPPRSAAVRDPDPHCVPVFRRKCPPARAGDSSDVPS